MTPDKLQGWIYKVVPGGRHLVVVHEQALGQGLTVASWTREEVDAAKETGINQAEQLLDAAQDHADGIGETCRFLIQWISEVGRPLRTLIHRSVPSELPSNEHAARADLVSPNAMVGQLLSHIHQQQKVLNGSIGHVLQAYERAMAMQQTVIAQQGQLLTVHRKQLAQLSETTTPETTEIATLKARAFEKLIEFAPDVLKLAIVSFAPNGGGADADPSGDGGEASPPDEAATAPPTNGKGAAAA